MSQVKVVERRMRINKLDIIKYQILTYCFFNGITVTSLVLDGLVQLALQSSAELNTFCMHIGGPNKIFSSAQSARNAINKISNNKDSSKNLVVKKGKNKKEIQLNPEMNIQAEGFIMLDYKFLASDTQKS